MSSVSKDKSSIWYGYLVAGERSTPVLRDSRLDTGNRKTVYLFNLQRGEIIEYALEIVEKKLRELKSSESGWIAELDAGYKKSRRGFNGRGNRANTSVADAPGMPHQPAGSYDEDNEDSSDDSDMWLEPEEA